MRAAIYARKSTEQHGVADDHRSVARQIAQATAFATARGWTVNAEHLYADDGISGAIFGAGRPGLMRLLNALQPRPPFDVLIMSEESRLGREMHQTAHLFGEIIRAGVRIFFYLEGRERTLETAMDKMMLSLTTFGAELEREKARQRTRDAMVRKAQAGHVTGGRVFGYDNVRLATHVERRINPAEAAVVRRIYELAAAGYGLRAIAHKLNTEGAPAPRPQQGRPAGWAPSTVRDVLGRAIYRGVIEWDRYRRDGERRQLKRGLNPDPIRVEAPQLRIVSAELAAAVDRARHERRVQYHEATPAPAVRAVKYLLSGLLRCPCGARYEAQGGRHGQRPGGIYLCSAARRKGRAVCDSRVHLPIRSTDDALLEKVESRLLSADVFEEIVETTIADLRQDEHARGSLERERVTLERELANLTQVIAGGATDVQTLLREMRRREDRIREIRQALSTPVLSTRELTRLIGQHLAEWKTLLRTAPRDGNEILRILLRGEIRLAHPTRTGVPWSSDVNLSGLFGLVQRVASPARAIRVGPAAIDRLTGIFRAAA